MPTNEMNKGSSSRRAARRSQRRERQELRASRREKRIAAKKADIQERPQKIRKRLIPIWLRLILVALFCFGALIAGLMFGYGVIGEGEPADALDKSTWQHIIDIVTKQK